MLPDFALTNVMAMPFINSKLSRYMGGIKAFCVCCPYRQYSALVKFSFSIGLSNKPHPLSRRFFRVLFDGTPLKIANDVICRVSVNMVDYRERFRVFYESHCNNPVNKFRLLLTAPIGQPNAQMSTAVGLLFKYFPALRSDPSVSADRNSFWGAVNAAKIANLVPAFIANNFSPLLFHKHPISKEYATMLPHNRTLE